MLYRIKAGGHEYFLVRASDDAVMKIARQKIWQVRPGEKIQVFRGTRLINQWTKLSMFDDLDKDYWGLSPDV